MGSLKCWLVGTDDLGYLLYWTETRARARVLGASEMCYPTSLNSFEDAMALRAVRVPELDGLEGDNRDDRMFLIAGIWVECSGCHCRIDLETWIDDYNEAVIRRPYLESTEHSNVWCEICARDIDGAFEATRDDLIRAVRTNYESEVAHA